jgi:hypothetical protein
MVINSNIKQKRRVGKCCTAVLHHGKITMRSTQRPRNIIMWNESHVKKLREEGDEDNEHSVTLKFRVGM